MTATLQEKLQRAERCCIENAAALDVLESTFTQSTRLVSWYDDDDWGQFEEVPIQGDGGNPPDNTIDLVVSNGIGTITGSGGTHQDDARLFLLEEDLIASDVQVYIDYSISSNDVIFGVAVRASESEAVVIWNDNSSGFTINLLSGVWEYSGQAITDENQGANLQGLVDQRILKAEGDGADMVVFTPTAHLLDTAGEDVLLNFGPFTDDTFTVTPINASSFEFASVETGSFTQEDGNWAQESIEPPIDKRRKIALRLIDDLIVFKQWRPGESEPNWADPLRSTFNELPASLSGSGLPPPSDGRVGIVARNLDGGRSISVNDLEITIVQNGEVSL
jgi:hypothetical protein